MINLSRSGILWNDGLDKGREYGLEYCERQRKGLQRANLWRARTSGAFLCVMRCISILVVLADSTKTQRRCRTPSRLFGEGSRTGSNDVQ